MNVLETIDRCFGSDAPYADLVAARLEIPIYVMLLTNDEVETLKCAVSGFADDNLASAAAHPLVEALLLFYPSHRCVGIYRNVALLHKQDDQSRGVKPLR